MRILSTSCTQEQIACLNSGVVTPVTTKRNGASLGVTQRIEKGLVRV